MKSTLQAFFKTGFIAGFLLNVILKLAFHTWNEAEGIVQFASWLVVPGIFYGAILGGLLVPIGFLYAWFSKPANERAAMLNVESKNRSPFPIAVAGGAMCAYQAYLLASSPDASGARFGWLLGALIGTAVGTVVACVFTRSSRVAHDMTGSSNETNETIETKEKKLGGFTKTLLVVVVLGVGSLFAWVPISKYLAGRRMRNDVISWAEKIKRTDGNAERYDASTSLGDPENPFAKKIRFSVHTAVVDENGYYEKRLKWNGHQMEDAEDPKRFYVIPPGEWVDDIDAVLATWDSEYRKYTEQGLRPGVPGR